jgi:hypothetical protein
MYAWHETKSSQNDFDPITDSRDSLYIGINLVNHNQRIKELIKADFFSQKFIDDYNTIALSIDKGLKDNALEWFVGDMPPYTNDANPWCNCHDNPEKYWETITLKNVVLDKNTASFEWTWGDDFKYKVKATRESNMWKISYLEGFDVDSFVAQ